MADPAVQRFFGTLVVQATLADPTAECDAILARIIALAEAYTGDVSAPAQPRFRWKAQVEALDLSPGATRPLLPAPGGFWTAHVLRGPSGAKGDVLIEDPRSAILKAATSGLSFHERGSPPASTIHRVHLRAGDLVMMPAFVPCGLDCPAGEQPQQWLVVKLTPQRL